MRKWLIEKREKKKMTQEQVATLANIKRPYYSQIESGKRRPSPEVAKRIAAVLKFNWTIFFASEGNESLHRSEAK